VLFQLDVFKRVILHNVLESIALLADAVTSFDRFWRAGSKRTKRASARAWPGRTGETGIIRSCPVMPPWRAR
jgi:hypothetical protein